MKNKRTVFSKQIVLICAIILLAFCIRLGLLLVSDDFHGVSNGRIIRAQLILKNDLPRGEWYSPVHPPVHLLLLMGAIKVFNDPVLAPRLISLFCGTLLLLPFYYCVKSLFDEQTAVFSILAAALYSEHIVYSVIATSETTFHFFLFFSLSLLLLYLRQRSVNYLLSAAFCLGMASLCRYEGLLFVPIFVFVIKKDMKNAVLFVITAMAAPGIWMLINYIYSQDPLQFINTNDFTVPLQFGWIRSQGVKMGFVEKASFWPVSLINTLGVFMFICGIAGILDALYKRRNSLFAGIFILLLFVFIARTIRESLYIQPRYAITLGLLLIPNGIYYFNKIVRKIVGHKIKNHAVITLLLVGSMIPAIGRGVLSEDLYAPAFAKQVAAFMKDNISEQDQIILDHCGDEKYREPIKVLSGINPKQFVLMPYLVPKDGQWLADKEMFFKVLKEAKIDVLIYSPKGDLENILDLEEKEKQSSINGFSFLLFGKIGPYLFYKIKPEDTKGRYLLRS